MFSNLLCNAIDASTGGSKLILRSKEELLLGQRAVRQVRVQIEDFGTGIPAKYVARIFEPFFTTKADVGTGLGLWLSKQIVEKNRGCIEFRTRNEGSHTGSCFSVVLPVGASQTAEPARMYSNEDPPTLSPLAK